MQKFRSTQPAPPSSGSTGVTPVQPIPGTSGGKVVPMPPPPTPITVTPPVPIIRNAPAMPIAPVPTLDKDEIETMMDNKCVEAVLSASESQGVQVVGYVMTALKLLESPGWSIGQILQHLPDVMGDEYVETPARVWSREVIGVVHVLTKAFARHMNRVGEIPKSRQDAQLSKQSPTSVQY